MAGGVREERETRRRCTRVGSGDHALTQRTAGPVAGPVAALSAVCATCATCAAGARRRAIDVAPPMPPMHFTPPMSLDPSRTIDVVDRFTRID
jgi:hypothetical protein